MTQLKPRSLDYCKLYFPRQNRTNSLEESNYGRVGDYGDNQEISKFFWGEKKFSLPFTEDLFLCHINPMFDTLQP